MRDANGNIDYGFVVGLIILAAMPIMTGLALLIAHGII